MFSLTLQTIFLATLQILFISALGFIFTKKKFITEEALASISGLLINLFLPCFIIHQFLNHFDFESFPNWWIFPLISFSVTLCGFLVGQAVCAFRKDVVSKKEFISLVTFQNSGYLPLILVSALFSKEQTQILYVYIFLFLIGFDLVLWSLGVWVLTKHRMEKFELKNLIHSPVVAILFSLGIVYLGWQKFIPQFMMSPLRMLGDCTLPMAMIVLGGNLARLRISDFRLDDILLVIGAKIVILPVLALGFLALFPADYLLGFLIVLEAAVPSSVSLSVIARHYGIEEKFINQGIFFSHLLSILTIPVFLTIYGTMI